MKWAIVCAGFLTHRTISPSGEYPRLSRRRPQIRPPAGWESGFTNYADRSTLPVSDLRTFPLSRLERPIKIHSRILDGDLWLVPPDCADQAFDAPVYTLDECRILLILELTPTELQAAHLAKTLFEGDLDLPDDTAGLRRLYSRLLQKFRALEKQLDGRVSPADEIRLLQAARHLSRILDRAETLDENPDDTPGMDSGNRR